MEYCKVIVTCGARDRAIRTTARYPDHNQKLIDHGDYMNMWSFIHDNEVKWFGGVEFDTLIICNDQVSYDTWKYADGARTRNGVYRVFKRENDGGSFGGYNWAFRNTDYDFYLFTEDDLIVYGDRYYEILLDTYKSYEKPVFVGLIGISPWVHWPRHCHGGVGLTSREVLKSIVDIDGNLPHSKNGWDRQVAIREGEIPFTAKMVEAGYDLVTVKPIEDWSPQNLIMPYYELHNTNV